MATIPESSESTTEVTSNLKKQIVTDQSYVFKVLTGDLPEKQFVCVTGSLWELGEWVVEKSLKLNKKENGVWEFPISIPHLMEINYRYLVCSELNWRGENKLIVEQFESTVHPRKFVSSTAVKGSTPVVAEDGEFGTTRRGEHSVDEGWLQHVSELQLHLHSSTEQGIRLEGALQADEYKIKISSSDCRGDMGKCLSTQFKVLDVISGKSNLFEGQERVRCHKNDMIVYTARLPDFSNSAFIVDIFSSKDDQFLGRSSILPEQLKDDAGRLILTVFNKEMLPVGVIQFDFIIVHPLEHDPVHNISKVFTKQWNKTGQYVDIGHRGMGCSFDHSQEHGMRTRSSLTENTIASLEQAAANGADLVEFDVVLTSDMVPVLYHDFEVCTTLYHHATGVQERYLVDIKDLTFEQLHRLDLEHMRAMTHTGLHHTSYPASDSNSQAGNSDLDCEFFSLNRSNKNAPKRNTFPSLEETLRELPESVGFDVEVKYPVPNTDGEFAYPYFERNLVADIILKTLFKHAGDRRICLTCFDPDMCSMLRLKQSRFPVLFLSNTEAYLEETCINIRTRTLNAAICFAESQKLLGIAAYSTLFLTNSCLVDAVLSRGLVLFTWGDPNNSKENIERQQKSGVHGVIYDRTLLKNCSDGQRDCDFLPNVFGPLNQCLKIESERRKMYNKLFLIPTLQSYLSSIIHPLPQAPLLLATD